MRSPPSPVVRYHDGTKHHFNRFARSAGYLDWASQPHPFRSFSGTRLWPLWPAPEAPVGAYAPRHVAYDRLFARSIDPEPMTAAAIGDLLRHAFGLSAWKQFGRSRWSLRVNPSSGNLHPTEAYVVSGSCPGLADTPAVYHYAADRHGLECRCAFDEAAWRSACSGRRDVLLVALTSIHWREAWKYGERAFRYCQHDLGHAIAALTIAASMLGWCAVLLPRWSRRDIGALTGVDRDEDYVDAEREEPGCVIAVVPHDVPDGIATGGALVASIRHGRWSGNASQLSEDHVQWTFIDEIATATEDPGRAVSAAALAAAAAEYSIDERRDARALIRQRRSAVALDGRSSMGAPQFLSMLSRVMPVDRSPWTALWWTPRIHLLLFVHRVEGIAPGLYLLGRDDRGLERLKTAVHRDFSWRPAHDRLPLLCLAPGDCRGLARRLSCDQDIAADGFFSLGMIADFEASLDEFGPSFYRHLFWESGVIGQVLYLEAEAAGTRATGIGCFYDDPVHETLGLEGHAFQSLYHFTVGVPVEDHRLTSAPGYTWEA